MNGRNQTLRKTVIAADADYVVQHFAHRVLHVLNSTINFLLRGQIVRAGLVLFKVFHPPHALFYKVCYGAVKLKQFSQNL